MANEELLLLRKPLRFDLVALGAGRLCFITGFDADRGHGLPHGMSHFFSGQVIADDTPADASTILDEFDKLSLMSCLGVDQRINLVNDGTENHALVDLSLGLEITRDVCGNKLAKEFVTRSIVRTLTSTADYIVGTRRREVVEWPFCVSNSCVQL